VYNGIIFEIYSDLHGRNPMPDAELKHILKELGETISETLAESPKISSHLQKIRNAGYELMLIIEAKVGFNDKESFHKSVVSDIPSDLAKLKITPEDAKFLKSLKISTE
jgi:hypothetical protein